jgi:hypothetical protein
VAVGGEVTAVDNLVNGKRENLSDLPAERFRLEVVDVRDGERMSGLLTKAELVLHLACATATLNCIAELDLPDDTWLSGRVLVSDAVRLRSSSPWSSALHQGMSASAFCRSTSALDVAASVIPWVGSTRYCRSPTSRRQTSLRPDNTAYEDLASARN